VKTAVASGYIRKNAVIEAVKVTRRNMKDVAEWCGGEIKNFGVAHGDHIHVPIAKSRFNKPDRAYAGDYVMYDADGFKVYSEKAFESSYTEPDTEDHKYQRVLKLVRTAMLEQDATTYHQDGRDMRRLAEVITAQIVGII
jgi:hypothetical protein